MFQEALQLQAYRDNWSPNFGLKSIYQIIKLQLLFESKRTIAKPCFLETFLKSLNNKLKSYGVFSKTFTEMAHGSLRCLEKNPNCSSIGVFLVMCGKRTLAGQKGRRSKAI